MENKKLPLAIRILLVIICILLWGGATILVKYNPLGVSSPALLGIINVVVVAVAAIFNLIIIVKV